MAKAGVKVSTDLAEWLIVALILFSLFVEVLLHKLEHWIAHKHVHLQSVLRNLYRELMILGLVSFGFVLFVIISSPNDQVKLSFEVAHIFIFLFAVFHTFVVMCTVFMSLRLSARWKRLERMDLVKYLEKKDRYRKLRERLNRHKSIVWRYFRWWFPKGSRLFTYWKLHEIMAFHDIRFQFIYYRNLPHDFCFSSFLRKVKSATFIELVEPHWSHYLFFLAVVLADILRRQVIISTEQKFLDTKFEAAFLIADDVLNILLVSLLAAKIRHVYWKMTRNPATYYNDVNKQEIEEELLIAEEEERIEKEQQPSSRNSNRPTVAVPRVASPQGESEPLSREDVYRGSSVDRPRERNTRTSTEFREGRSSRPRSARASLELKSSPLYTNLAYKPHLSLPSSGTATPSTKGDDGELDLEDVVARHSLDLARKGTLDLSNVSNKEALTAGNSPRYSGSAMQAEQNVSSGDGRAGNLSRPSERSSFDKPGLYVPNLRRADGSIAMDEVVSAAARRRSLEKPRQGNLEDVITPSRQSVDGRKGIHTPISLRASLDGRGTSTPLRGEVRTSLELVRNLPRDELSRRDEAEEPVSTTSRRSLELNRTLPRGELAKRDADPGDLDSLAVAKRNPHQVIDMDGPAGPAGPHSSRDESDGNVNSEGSYTQRRRAEAIRRLNVRNAANPSIIKNARLNERAQQLEPQANYPKWLVKALPRLGRVASPAEKLFWFGSHRFYLWCVEWVLFFATVNVAATLAQFGMVVKEINDKAEKEGKPAKPIPVINIAAVVVTFIALFYVLLRIAGIMKKYIFVLNNANMVPETMTIQAIQTVRLKANLQTDVYDSRGAESDDSDDETEDSDAARERRRKFWKFFNNEAEGGNASEGGSEMGRGSKLRRFSIASRRSTQRDGRNSTDNVEAVASQSMDGSSTADAVWQT